MNEIANPRAVIGDNAPTPFDLLSEQIENLRVEAGNWLDGAGVTTEADAENVSKLLDLTRKAQKEADSARVTEKKPHDDAAKAVQAKWKPLIDRCDIITDTAKKALTPYLRRVEAAKQEAARIAREEAEAAERAAQAAFAQSGPTDIEMREEAERLAKAAKSAEALASKMEKDKAHATGGDRAIGLRTSYRAEVTDMTEFARWAWVNLRDDIEAALLEIARKKFSRAAVTPPPGITIHEERNAA